MHGERSSEYFFYSILMTGYTDCKLWHILWPRFSPSLSLFLVLWARFNLLRELKFNVCRVLNYVSLHFTESVFTSWLTLYGVCTLLYLQATYFCLYSKSTRHRVHAAKFRKITVLVTQICTLLLSCCVIFLIFNSYYLCTSEQELQQCEIE